MYKKNINGKLALGYGSKYQLLRMLGWHRNEFNKDIANTLGLNNSNINWLDFGFSGPCDAELLNADFIPSLSKKWRDFWACGDGGINWDAVGIAPENIHILVEAKAHLSELHGRPIGGIETSVENNKKRIQKFIDKYGIKSTAEDWAINHYQLANRLVMTDFLNENGVKAQFIYVLFENGYEYNTDKCQSASKEEWKQAIKTEMEEMGLLGTDAEKLAHYCVVNCNRK